MVTVVRECTTKLLGWALYLCRYARFGDARLKLRLILILDALVAHPTASLAEALGSPQQVRAYYDFVNNPRVTPERLRDVASEDTCARLRQEPLILAVQDGTAYNYTHHPATTGQGPLANAHATGFFVQTTLAVSPDGVPQGVLHQQCWARDPEAPGTREQRRQRAYAEKESVYWLESLQATEAALDDAGVQILTIADREADIYELFATPRGAQSHLLIRVGGRERRVTVPTDPTLRYLREAVEAAPIVGGRTVEVRRAPERPPRLAKVLIKMVTLRLHKPRHGKHQDLGQPQVTVVVVQEVDPPADQTPIYWLLATTWPVPDLETACTVVYWYSLRWLVERYHYTLKSGCRVEELQLRSVDALERALLIYTLVAWRLLWLTYLARVAPELPCTVALTPDEWQTLHIATEATPVPDAPPTLQTAMHQLARLGGHRGWPSTHPPGVKVLWRGWTQLQGMVTYVQRAAAVAARAAEGEPRAGTAPPQRLSSKPAFKRAA
jgi:hypothetical protein